MFRRRPAGIFAFLTAVWAVVALLVPLADQALGASRPNVLLILTDDQRPWGALGTEDFVVSRIRDRGVTYQRAYVTTPLCCPSRASPLTGLYMHNHGVENNKEPLDVLKSIDAMTIADALHADGYTTGMFGKYLNGWPNDVTPSGFDRFAITPRVTYDPAEWDVNGTVKQIDAYATMFIRRQSLSFLDLAASLGKPWFASALSSGIAPRPRPGYWA